MTPESLKEVHFLDQRDVAVTPHLFQISAYFVKLVKLVQFDKSSDSCQCVRQVIVQGV